jgi:hypothetical protein
MHITFSIKAKIIKKSLDYKYLKEKKFLSFSILSSFILTSGIFLIRYPLCPFLGEMCKTESKSVAHYNQTHKMMLFPVPLGPIFFTVPMPPLVRL